MKKRILSSVIASIFVSISAGAAPHYQVNMRVGIKGQSPISINTVAKSGKKSFISQFSDDGQTETLVEVYSKKSQVNKKDGLFMDVQVTRRVRGQSKITERAQIFAPENQEMEFGTNSKGKTAGNLSLAVMAHQL
ncbi:MAG: hypothetical protein KUL82_04820 [Bdellovibrio sp.]|uniref:hypothetical protein n=1 Tax=Bdellovibrio sp. TaxID=28201 RepID=UPI0039E2F214|nr:hypothetical protein [Bdellovibrio sp.]